MAGESETGLAGNGIAAVLFYLVAYGVMNLGAFAVVASLERRGRDGSIDEADSFHDLRGLCLRRPVLGWTMVLSAVGLLGLPLTLGFIAKLPLFTAGIAAGEIPLVIILGINSAIAAFYYLRLAAAPLLEQPEEPIGQGELTVTPYRTRVLGGALSAAGVLVLGIFASPLGDAAERAATAPQRVPAQERVEREGREEREGERQERGGAERAEDAEGRLGLREPRR